MTKKVGNAETEELSRKICKDIKRRRKTLVAIVTRWRYNNSYKELRSEKKNQTKIWRECEPVIRRANKLAEYHAIWTKEKRRLKKMYKEKAEKKIKHLQDKYGDKQLTPDEIEGIIIKDQRYGAAGR